VTAFRQHRRADQKEPDVLLVHLALLVGEIGREEVTGSVEQALHEQGLGVAVARHADCDLKGWHKSSFRWCRATSGSRRFHCCLPISSTDQGRWPILPEAPCSAPPAG